MMRVLSLSLVAFAGVLLLHHEAQSSVPARQIERTVWDGVYTASQAERGHALFDEECTRCHEVSDFVGEEYIATWEGQTLRDFYLYISSGMPPDLHEEIVEFQAYSDILAYVLQSNHFPTGPRELGANLDRLNLIRIERMPETAR
jgi:hypothetical protein